ncbi:DUF6455 family protein [Roseibacterium sp. SDUM158017]|uniref:DUF6455 family protein n=1 Tax=Roseicyclus salinarum TaxID=3036773 RepID=UPI002414EFC6|nr:DUF6455 family protein [Roseibacterium sp. SDUM158017]MDG4648260.1 DUF6455 family protein [Roseibacterium sp. SDUM158017]
MTRHRVRPLGREGRHYWLALSMARATGADLQRALDEGRITHGDWASAVQTCRGCSWAEGCECWLGSRDPATAADVPQACPNAGLLERVLAGATQPADPVSS